MGLCRVGKKGVGCEGKMDHRKTVSLKKKGVEFQLIGDWGEGTAVEEWVGWGEFSINSTRFSRSR